MRKVGISRVFYPQGCGKLRGVENPYGNWGFEATEASYPLFHRPNNNNKYLNISSTGSATFFEGYGKLAKRLLMRKEIKRNREKLERANEALPYPTGRNVPTTQAGSFCPNCGARLEGRKCKLLCPTPGCGYLVTCSEW